MICNYRRTALTPDEWYEQYYVRGRPVIIQGALPLAERCSLSKANATANPLINGSLACGSTAYPSITRQSFCPQACTLDSLERGVKCKIPTLGSAPSKKQEAGQHSEEDTKFAYFSPTAVKANIQMIVPALGELGKQWQEEEGDEGQPKRRRKSASTPSLDIIL